METSSENAVLSPSKALPKHRHYILEPPAPSSGRKATRQCHFPDDSGPAEKSASLGAFQRRQQSGLGAVQQSQCERLSGRCATKGSRGQPDQKTTALSSRPYAGVVTDRQRVVRASVKGPVGTATKRGVTNQKTVGASSPSKPPVDVRHSSPRFENRRSSSKFDQRSCVSQVNKTGPVLGNNSRASLPPEVRAQRLSEPAGDRPNNGSARSGQRLQKSNVPLPKSNSEPYHQERLKSVLTVLRSGLSAEEKLLAIKCNRDRWNERHGNKKRAATKERPRDATSGLNCRPDEEVLVASRLPAGSRPTHPTAKGAATSIAPDEKNDQKMSGRCEELTPVIETDEVERPTSAVVLSGQTLLTTSCGASKPGQVPEEGVCGHQGVSQPIESNVKKKVCGSEGAVVDVHSLDRTREVQCSAEALQGTRCRGDAPLETVGHLGGCGHTWQSSRDGSGVKLTNSVKRLGKRLFSRASSCPEFGQNGVFHSTQTVNETLGGDDVSPSRRHNWRPATNLGRSFAHADCDPFICDESREHSLRSVHSSNDVKSGPAVTAAVAAGHRPSVKSAKTTWQYFKNRATGDSAKEKKGDVLPTQTNSKPKCSRLLLVTSAVDTREQRSFNSDQDKYGRTKSPVTVQEWVDSISLGHRHEDGPEVSAKQPQALHLEAVDNFNLGAEAYHECKQKPKSCKAQLRRSNQTITYGQIRDANSSFQSDTSAASTFSISSVEALLETMQHNPEEILLGLGFGSAAPDPLTRIPERFLHPSQVNGNNLQEFLKKQQEMLEMYDMGFSGYRGLSGFSLDGRGPSGIVYKILEKIRDRNRELKRTLAAPNSSASPPSLCFYRAAFSLMAVNAFRNSIKNSTGSSILERENREFLDSQEGSLKSSRRRRPRLVLGKDSFTLDTDEELIDDEDGTNQRSPSPNQKAFGGSGHAAGDRRNGRPSPRKSGRTSGSAGSSPTSRTSEGSRKISDDVFVPTDNKSSFWGILRSMRMPSTPQSSPPPLVCHEAKAWPNRRQSLLQSVQSVDGSTSSNSKVDSVSGNSCKRASRLTRQASVDDDHSSETESASLICPKRHMKLGSLKMETAANKDSFELEELPAINDVQDGDVMDHAGRLHVNSGDTPRTSSAMSDSSGFLEGETLEVSNELLEDTLLNIVLSENSDEENPSSVNFQSETAAGSPDDISNLDDASQTKVPLISAGADVDCPKVIVGRRSPLLAMNQSESGFESFGTLEKDEISCPKIGEGTHTPVGYLSESDTIVMEAASSTSSGAFDQSQNFSQSVSNLLQADGARPNTCTREFEWLNVPITNQLHHHLTKVPEPPVRSKVDRSKSVSEMDLTCANVRHLQHLGLRGLRSSLENVNIPLDEVSLSLPKRLKLATIHSSYDLRVDGFHALAGSGKINDFHKSCLSVVQRMQDVLQLYQKKLKGMEQSCVDTYCHYCSGITKPERDELEKLKELRKLILEETNKTNLLLSNRSKSIACHPSNRCDKQLVAVAEELGELLRQQNMFIKQMDEVHHNFLPPNCNPCWHRSSVTPPISEGDRIHEFLQSMKQEIMAEIRNILQGDREKFQSILKTTQREIEDMKSLLTGLLSALQAKKV